jgi:predicted AAA+ superfamily ATPase
MIKRHITSALLHALKDNPVVLLNGARQTGKSTLVKWLAERRYRARYLTMDDATTLAAASANPEGFLTGFESPIILDEVQRIPELFLPIKAIVDRNRTPGRFLLTGSANVLFLPRLSESLAGRMEILNLWQFSQGELEDTNDRFIDAVFSNKFLPANSPPRSDIFKTLALGGYPEIQKRKEPQRRHAWFESYITTILQRDVRELAHINGLTAMPRLLALLASRVGTMLNFAELSRSIVLPQTTLKRYLSLLETTFLIRLLPAWATNRSKRIIRTPKLYLTDTGLALHLCGVDEQLLKCDHTPLGHFLENFVIMELTKQATWSHERVTMYYFRTHAGQEVDFILERPDGAVVGIEVKASMQVDKSSFTGLNTLREILKKNFIRGVVFYMGNETIPFGNDMTALPISNLWQ